MGPTSFYFVILNFFMGVNADACAREWLQYQGNCYGYFESKLTWHEAEIECQSYHRGAHLASVLTVAETLVVADHISAYQAEHSSVWIGLHDIRHDNFHWLFLITLYLLAGGLMLLCLSIHLFPKLYCLCLQYNDGRLLLKLHSTFHFLHLGLKLLALMLILLASFFILLDLITLCFQNGKWRWSDESVYNYKAWALGSHNNQEENGFCVELLNSVNGAPVPSNGRVEEIEERPISHHKDFTKWKAVPCHKLNAYLCKHEL